MKLEMAIILGFLEEDDLAISTIEPSSNDNFFIDRCRGQEGRQLLQIQTGLFGLNLIVHFLFL
jgi:hypothetical protein